jgi:two-component system, cell cycle sensor histidine kinase and response regulator CckA
MPNDERNRRLLEALTHAHADFALTSDDNAVFERLLGTLLELSNSEYGFIGEVLFDLEGGPYLKTHAITNIAWDDETRQFYATNAPSGLEFHNLKTLFGVVLTSGEPLISNDPTNDPRRGGIPKGHPPLNAFLGVPIRHAGDLVGMVGIANRPGGYAEEFLEFLSPFFTMCGGFIAGRRAEIGRREMETLLASERQILELITRGSPSQDVLDTLCRSAEEQFPGVFCSILLVADDGASLVCAAAPSLPEKFIRAVDGILIGPSSGACGRAAFLGAPVLVDEVRTSSLMRDYFDLANEFGIEACWSYPIRSQTGEVWGTFAFYRGTVGSPPPRVSRFVERWVHLAGIAIERERAAMALRNSEAQLEHSRRLEAIGRLAGGVAHDFNNLLTIIVGYADFLRRGLTQSDPLQREVVEIARAADRATDLTRQLLAFSRKQILRPVVLDPNDAMTQMDSLLRRIIGEDITLVTCLDPTLRRARVDRGQLEQVIVNLAANARDAMPEGGTLTLETASVYLDAEFTRGKEGLAPGPYVMIAVSDTGVGMDADTQARIFDPFFTTKEVGKGTGLGLSTVYGIVKQSGGHVTVRSEQGRGTTFRVYLPAVDAPEGKSEMPFVPSDALQGHEIVLVVEDDDGVRRLACDTLKRCGYSVLEARNGVEAIEIAEETSGPIHALVTDVVMPQMGGRRLADRLVETRPNIAVLFMSGYTEDSMLRHGVLHNDVAFLHKPFTPSALASKLREALDLVRESKAREPRL